MPKIKYKHYLLILLTVVAAFNYLDRFVLSLVIEPIKHEFGLSDTQLGFLSGFAFASFYALAGVPLARWADRGNRNTIVTLTTGLWSAMVAICGVVTSFTQLLLVRVGVAVGEAGCLPPANSLIADYFDREERPKAMAIYWLCSPLAVIIGYLGGGWLIEQVGWRLTFVIIGVPGVLLALLAKFTIIEPRATQRETATSKQPTFKYVISILWQRQSVRYVVIAFSVLYFFSMGFAQWLPAFFMRSHGMEIAEVGAWFALTWGAVGIVGTYLGGVLVSRFASCQEAKQLHWCSLAIGVSGLCYFFVFIAVNKYLAIACMSAAAVLGAMCNGPIFSVIQSLVIERMRSVTLAVIFLMANFIGLGLGPLAAGLLSDYLGPLMGEESLRYALAAFAPGYVFVSYFFWKAAKTVEADIEGVELETCNSISQATDHNPLESETNTQTTLGYNQS